MFQSTPLHCRSLIDSSSNKCEYQVYFLGGKGGRCVGLTTLPNLCADILELWEPEPPGTLRVCPDTWYEVCFVICCIAFELVRFECGA